jgi:cytosolic carboxypeptidase protein 5
VKVASDVECSSGGEECPQPQ